MAHFDIFNGDADGIFSLIQLRKQTPLDAVKITGIKRDIQLVKKCQAKANDTVTVLDISMEKNLSALQQLLLDGAMIFYADHHRSGDIPQTPMLDAHIDLSPDTCTSLIVDEYLNGAQRLWAIAGAFGDNMNQAAEALANQLHLSMEEISYLKELGTLINYNGYGANISDLYFEPAHLYEQLMRYDTPFDLLDDPASAYFQLRDGYKKDMAMAQGLTPYFSDDVLTVYYLPNAASSRRVSGVFGNYCANQSARKAHLILTDNPDGTLTVSMRAPLENKQGADVICCQFETGGGRAAAAGINALPMSQLDDLIDVTLAYYDA